MTIAQIREATDYVKSRQVPQPTYGIILGTGLGTLVNELEDPIEIDYEDIPHFPVSTIEFHKGKLIFGRFGDRHVVVMQGRFHYYEGYSMKQVTFPVRVLKMLGIRKLFISNAAGGLKEHFQVSDLMIIEDHINLQPENPLTGPNIDELGSRFPDMSQPYDQDLIEQALAIANQQGIQVHQGVYTAVTGPNLETRAEYGYLSTIGADAVGMSTVPEVIVASHMDLPCFAISVITDLCYPGAIKKVVVEEIIEAARKAEPNLTMLFKELISKQL